MAGDADADDDDDGFMHTQFYIFHSFMDTLYDDVTIKWIDIEWNGLVRHGRSENKQWERCTAFVYTGGFVVSYARHG